MNFDQMTTRLKKEMDPAALQLLENRDFPSYVETTACILCVNLVPKYPPTSYAATCYHHIDPRGMGGGEPNRLPNLAPTCHEHHQEPYVSWRELWKYAMVKAGKAIAADYPDLDWVLFPPLGECIGHFGYGDSFYPQGIPPLVQQVFRLPVDVRLDRFCVYACQVAARCLDKTRQLKLKQLKAR